MDRYLFIAHWDTRDRADKDSDPTKQSVPILIGFDQFKLIYIYIYIYIFIKKLYIYYFYYN